MQRTTIMVPEEVLDRRRKLADERKVSMAAVIREALEAKAKTYSPKPRPKPESSRVLKKGDEVSPCCDPQ